MPFLLLVTLMLPQQQPYTYEIEFSSKENCEKAAADLQREFAERIAAQAGSSFSAICVAK